MADFYTSILEMPFLSEDYSFPIDVSNNQSNNNIVSSSESYSLYSVSAPQDILMSMPEISQNSLLSFDATTEQKFLPPTSLPLESNNNSSTQNNSNTNNTNNNNWAASARQISLQLGLTQFQEYQLQQDPDVFSIFGPSPASYLTTATQALSGQYFNPMIQILPTNTTQEQVQRQFPHPTLSVLPKSTPQNGMISPPETPTSTPSPVCLKPIASPDQFTRQMSPLSPTCSVTHEDMIFSNTESLADAFSGPNSPTPSLSDDVESSSSSIQLLQATTVVASGSTESLVKTNRITKSRKPSKAAIKAAAGMGVRCHNCGATVTPLWRRSANNEPLCNACGLYHKLHAMHRPKHLQQSMGHSHGVGGKSRYGKSMNSSSDERDGCSDSSSDSANGGSSACQQPMCSNCKTTLTPLWRKDDAGDILCNACGLYYKLHHIHRPISLKRNVIRRRSRYENGKSSSSASSASNAAALLHNSMSKANRFANGQVRPAMVPPMCAPIQIQAHHQHQHQQQAMNVSQVQQQQQHHQQQQMAIFGGQQVCMNPYQQMPFQMDYSSHQYIR